MKNTITCSEARELLAGYRFGDLTDGQLERVEAHLETCETCRAELAEVDLVLDAARTEPPAQAASSAAAARVMSRISADAPRRMALKLAPVFAAVAIMAGVLSAHYLGLMGNGTTSQPAAVATAEVDVELLENLDVLANLDMLEDMDTLEGIEEL